MQSIKMTDSANNTTEYISKFIRNLLPNAEVQLNPGLTFIIRAGTSSFEVRFGRDEADDFEVALEQYRNTNYFHTLDNRIKFRIYLILGSAGLLSDFNISSELLEEKGEWLKNYRIDIEFSDWFSKVLYEGLQRLSNSLSEILSSTGLQIDDIREDKDYVDGLVKYYEENGHLGSRGASMQSLSFLKAAAVSSILELEKRKKASSISRVQKRLDQEIYSIVAEIRKEHFRDIKLPECIYEYAIQIKNTPEEIEIVESIKQTIASNPASQKLDALLERLEPKLNRRREGAWQAFKSANPDRLSQAANSMVELLDQVIGLVCKDTNLAQYLTDKYQTHEETKWVDATRKWISETKSNLHRVKHHTDYESERLAESLLTSAENIMLVILE